MPKKIKIGFLTERMLKGFGVDLVVDQTARYLAAHDCEVFVFCLRQDQTFKDRPYKIIPVAYPLFKSPIKTARYVKKLLRQLNQEDIDFWIAESYPFFCASQIMTRPVIMVDHGVCSTQGFGLLKKLAFDLIRQTQNRLYFPKATKVINISQFTQALTPADLRKKQTIIYNGADHYSKPSNQEITAFKEKLKITAGDFTLLYVGRLNHEQQPYKGTKELTEIFGELKKEIPQLRLLMAGFGTKKDAQKLRRQGITVFPNATEQEITLLYSVASLYVSCSKWEGFNLPLVEAGRFGVPAVVYRLGAHSEVLPPEAGFLVKTKEELAKKIKILSGDRKLLKEKSVGAQKNAQRFTWEKAGQKYLAVINELKEKFSPQPLPYQEGLVDVIIVNYNGEKYLPNLLDSLRRQTYTNIKVTVVDNASADGSVALIKKDYPKVSLIESKENLFFSRGNNLAIGKTKGEYILFLNNDTVAQETAIEEMVSTVERQGKYRVCGVAAKMLFLKNKNLIDSVGTVITNNGSPFNRGIGQLDIGQYDCEEEVFGACFGAALVRRLVYQKTVGPLDNDYYGYFEDIDWSFRARIMGYKFFASPLAVVYHDHSGSSKQRNYNWKYYYIHRNFLWTLIKDFKPYKALTEIFWKKIGLIKYFLEKKSWEDKKVVPKILGSTVVALPRLLWKRWRIQGARLLSDYECLKFQKGEMPVFDPVRYLPEYSLNNLFLMFSKLDKLNQKKIRSQKSDPVTINQSVIATIAAKAKTLNRCSKKLSAKEFRERVQELTQKTIPFIRKEEAEKFAKAITKK
jgi:GT2 family glycosyltransferase/glycosyltransferase involved in cell wall biosynthesis